MTAVATAATPIHTRTTRLLPALILVVATVAITHWATATYVVGVFHDDGIYALLARSIASGQGLHYANLPGAPAATHYPPLYPMLLAAAWRVAPSFPANVPRLLTVNAILVGVAAWGCWWFTTAQLGWRPGRAAAAALIATLASPVLALAGALVSESMFLAMLWPALVLSDRAALSASRTRVAWTSLLLGVLMLVRMHALALVIALMLVLLVHRRWRDATLSVGIVVLVQLPWQLWTRVAGPRVAEPLEGAYGSYLAWFASGVRGGGPRFVLATAQANAAECWLLLQDRFAVGGPAELRWVVLGIVVASFLIGARSFARVAPVTIVFVVCYLAIVTVWPYAPWRFVWAIWPLLTLTSFQGARSAWIDSGRWRPAIALAAALPAFVMLRTELHAYATRGWRTPAKRAGAQIAPVAEWVRTHTAAHDVVLAEGEAVVALYADRLVAPPVSFTASEYIHPSSIAEGAHGLRAMLAAVPARYVVVLSPQMAHSADSLVAAHPGLRRIPGPATGAAYEVVP